MTASAGRATPRAAGPAARALGAVVLAMAAGGAAAGAVGASVSALLVVAGLLYGSRIVEARTLLAGLVLIILFLPIGRYTLPGGLPFQLEPYRIYVAVLLLIWLTGLLIDSNVRFRLTVMGAPLFALLAVAFVSVIANPHRLHTVGSFAIKRLTFLTSFVLVFFVAVSLVRRARDIHFVVSLLVAGGAVLGACSIIEYTTGHNVFGDLGKVLPLHDDGVPYSLHRGGSRIRAFASAQHPIAFGALEVVLLPLAAYLWHATHQRRWIGAGILLVLGTFASSSRTPMIMLAVLALTFTKVRWSSMKRLWPALFPMILAIHFVMPGAIGGIRSAFFPKGGLVAEQASGAGTYGSGRIADLSPALADWERHPFVGVGFGTRVTEKGPLQNASILDDQWLGTLLETGAVGVLIWAWIFIRVCRRLFREARADDTARGWLCAGLGASLLLFAVSMFTFDTLSFIQLTFTLFILLALAAAVLEVPARAWRGVHEAA